MSEWSAMERTPHWWCLVRRLGNCGRPKRTSIRPLRRRAEPVRVGPASARPSASADKPPTNGGGTSPAVAANARIATAPHTKPAPARAATAQGAAIAPGDRPPTPAHTYDTPATPAHRNNAQLPRCRAPATPVHPGRRAKTQPWPWASLSAQADAPARCPSMNAVTESATVPAAPVAAAIPY